MIDNRDRYCARQGLPAVARAPLEIIDALELGDTVDVGGMTDRSCAFKAVHMGERELSIGLLLDLVSTDTNLCPPRTGHIGNWGNIAKGHAGAMDFNKAICAPGYGYPLLYCFTQTEAETSRQGDWGYLPGSLVDGGVRFPLRLHAWDGAGFAPCTHASPRFTPFVQADVDGSLVPLIELHAQRLEPIGPRPFKLEQAIFCKHEATIRPLLTMLIDEARRRDNPRRALQELISHSVALDGALTRCDLALDGRGFKLGETYYPSTAALVEHAMVPFRAVGQPRQFMSEIFRLPPRLPLVSNLLITVLSAILETHRPGGKAPSSDGAGPLNPHLHWGGRDMAGYPPRNRGYLFDDGKLRSLKRVCATLVANFAEVQPLCLVLLPATAFMLCPTSVHPDDAGLLSHLFDRVRASPSGLDAGAVTDARAVEVITRAWHDCNGGKLSATFRDRFGPRRGGLPASADLRPSDPVEPEGFRDLTFRQASAIVGALYDIHTVAKEPS